MFEKISLSEDDVNKIINDNQELIDAEVHVDVKKVDDN